MRISTIILAVLFFLAGPQAAFADDAKVVKVQTKRGISQPFQFITPDSPKAGVILFTGSSGVLEDTKEALTIRIHKKLSERGLMVALVDSPSDRAEINAKFRISKKHAGDMAAVINYMKTQADVPIWLVGMAAGTFSAANVAIKKRKKVSGLVLISAINSPSIDDWGIARKFPKGVASMKLNKITAPVLILMHGKSRCKHTSPAEAPELKNKLSNSPEVKVVISEGGASIRNNPCDSFTHYGFYEIEDQVVEHITKFIIR